MTMPRAYIDLRRCPAWPRNVIAAVLGAIMVASMIRMLVPILAFALPSESAASELAAQAMMLDWRHFAGACGIASLGGLASLAHETKGAPEKVTLQNAVGHMFICQFAGVLMYLMTIEWGLGLPGGLAACGVSGWLGSAGIVRLSDMFFGGRGR